MESAHVMLTLIIDHYYVTCVISGFIFVVQEFHQQHIISINLYLRLHGFAPVCLFEQLPSTVDENSHLQSGLDHRPSTPDALRSSPGGI